MSARVPAELGRKQATGGRAGRAPKGPATGLPPGKRPVGGYPLSPGRRHPPKGDDWHRPGKPPKR